MRFGSWFQNSSLGFEDILKIAYYWSRNHLVIAELNISQTTCVDWFTFCREFCIEILQSTEGDVIGDPGLIVEIDESKFGKRKLNRVNLSMFF